MSKPTNQFSSFEKSAYKFIEELKNISIETSILHSSEVRKANMLICCVKAVVSSVEKEVREVEGRFKRGSNKTTSQ